MKRSAWRRIERARRTLSQPGVADEVAEALLCHDHECYANLAARQVLDMLQMSAVEFLIVWASGGYDVA